MTAWDFYAWVGIVTLSVLGLCCIHQLIETLQISRVGWTKMDELGFWRSTLALFRPLPWRINYAKDYLMSGQGV